MKTSILLLLLSAGNLSASPVTFNQPAIDRWMYPFNGTPGTRATASTFGALANPSFDERDAQFIIAFDTSTAFTPGLGAGNYQINSGILTLRHTGNSFVYDPTADAYTSYLDAGNPAHTADTDAGRPMELFGVGFRNGFTPSTFTETSSFGPPGKSTRNAFALGFRTGNPVDVSNNADTLNAGADGFDPVLFGLGTVSGLSPGDNVTDGSEITFNLNLASPDVRGYLQESLNQGLLWLAATSLHPATFGGPANYPVFETRENLVGQAGQLQLDVAVIPEPGTLVLLLGAAATLMMWRRRPQ